MTLGQKMHSVLKNYAARRKTHRALKYLNDETLSDIGVNRMEIDQFMDAKFYIDKFEERGRNV